MNCHQVQELFGEYWDFLEDDSRRHGVDEHIANCASCAEEFRIWRESTQLIQAAAISSIQPILPERVSQGVMNRIYADEAWRIPVADRTYRISYAMRQKLTAVISFCLALFIFSFSASLFIDSSSTSSQNQLEFSGLLPVANALGEADLAQLESGSIEGVAVASLSDPLILRMGIIETTPDYLLVVSLLGLISALLIMNWLSRIHA